MEVENVSEVYHSQTAKLKFLSYNGFINIHYSGSAFRGANKIINLINVVTIDSDVDVGLLFSTNQSLSFIDRNGLRRNVDLEGNNSQSKSIFVNLSVMGFDFLI